MKTLFEISFECRHLATLSEANARSSSIKVFPEQEVATEEEGKMGKPGEVHNKVGGRESLSLRLGEKMLNRLAVLY